MLLIIIISWTLLQILFNQIGYETTTGVRYLIAVVLGIIVGELVSRFSK
jgi:uncharacterized membrane protein YwzB